MIKYNQQSAMLPTAYAIAECSLSYSLREAPEERTKISSSKNFADFIREFYGDQIETREQFYAVYLNQANHVVAISLIGMGGMTSTVADIRLIIAIALQFPCTGIIVTHNHPSGNLTPSKNDEMLTKKLKQACLLMDIQLMDHIIITRHAHFSFNDNLLM